MISPWALAGGLPQQHSADLIPTQFSWQLPDFLPIAQQASQQCNLILARTGPAHEETLRCAAHVAYDSVNAIVAYLAQCWLRVPLTDENGSE